MDDNILPAEAFFNLDSIDREERRRREMAAALERLDPRDQCVNSTAWTSQNRHGTDLDTAHEEAHRPS